MEIIPLKIINKAPIKANRFKYSSKIIHPIRVDQRICKYTKQKIDA